jgi:Flp pilus assembly pilin Flp
MHSLNHLFLRLRTSRGQTMTEYVLILSAIAAVVVGLFGTGATIAKTVANQVIPLL